MTAANPTPRRTRTAAKAVAAAEAAKATHAKATAAKATAPAAEADLAALAANVTEIKELPKVANGGGGRTNPFRPLVEKAAKEKKAFTTPPVADAKQATRVIDALWRAGNTLGLKVSSRRVKNDDGTWSVAFTAEAK